MREVTEKERGYILRALGTAIESNEGLLDAYRDRFDRGEYLKGSGNVVRRWKSEIKHWYAIGDKLEKREK